MPTPADLRKQFIKAFNSLARQRERHAVLADFLETAVCAIRKRTLPPGPEAEALEAQYMAVVKRNRAEDVRAMPELLALTTLAVQGGGCDFLGQVVVELELPAEHMGQFFTPYDVSRMIAEMTFDTVDEIIAERGFVTVQEPACGAGGMILAAADAIEARGFDVARQLYVDGTDVSITCFRMSYLQASLRGVPATIRHGNTLSLEVFDQAVTPVFAGFYATHRERFDAWVRGPESHDAELSPEAAGDITGEPDIAPQAQPDLFTVPAPRPARPPARSAAAERRQLDLFE